MFKIIKFTLSPLILISLSSCKSENKSKVDKNPTPTLLAKMLSKNGIKRLLKEYEKYDDILAEVFQVTIESLKNGRKITIPKFSESSQKLLGEEDWLFKLLNPHSLWRDTYNGPVKDRAIMEFIDGRNIDYILSHTVDGDSNLEELIDFSSATDRIENIAQKLGLKAHRSTIGRQVTSLSMPDAALLNAKIHDINNELLLQGKVAQKDLILELPSLMVETEIRSNSPQEYLVNLANHGVFELDSQIGTPYNLSKPLYRVHQVLGISQEIYKQNRELAKRSLQYINFINTYLRDKTKSRYEQQIAQHCLNTFITSVKSVIDGNLKNAGRVEYFITHPQMAKKFFPTEIILRDYIRSLYDSRYFNQSLDKSLKNLFIASEMEMTQKFQKKGVDVMKIVDEQIELFTQSRYYNKEAIMELDENSEHVFARSIQRKKLLERSIIESQQK
jgi:hypothetical protein